MYQNNTDIIRLLDEIVARLTRLEDTLSKKTSASKSSISHSYDLGGYSLHRLAKRLGVTSMYLVQAEERLSTDKFIEWTRSKDPTKKGWMLSSDGNFYPEGE